MQEYITPKKCLKKLRGCRSIGNVTYMYGSTGFGKTELTQRFLLNKKHFYTSCKEKLWETEELEKYINSAKEPIVVIDDLHMLHDEEKRSEVISLTENYDIWLLLISRSDVPLWLSDQYIRRNFIRISEDDLKLTFEDVTEYMDSIEFEYEKTDIEWLVKESLGNAYIIKSAVIEIINGLTAGEELAEILFERYMDSLRSKVLEWLLPEVKDLLLRVSLVDEFDTELAKFITGNRRIGEVIIKAHESGNFMFRKGDSYVLREQMRIFLNNEIQREYSSEQIKSVLKNIALYYEINGDEGKAFEYCAKCSDLSKISEMLTRNSYNTADNGYYYEMRKYYLMLPDEEIEKEICLMSSISFLYSMMMNVEKSEYWYDRLKEKAETAKGSEKREILSRIAYLNLALPHRGSLNVLEIIKNSYKLLKDKSIPFPRFSVTSNLPSTMNGGKDFCEWSKKDTELAASVGKLVSAFLGSHGKGLVDLALAESFFEKGRDSYEITKHISKAKNEIESADINYNMAFVAAGIQARLYIINGEPDEAKTLIKDFAETVSHTSFAYKLMPNIKALMCRIALYEGNNKVVEEWLRYDAPDENEFFALNRYRYLTKILCYIAKERYSPAVFLINRLMDYAEKCDRTYISMELSILLAIIKYRMHDEWKEEFISTLYKVKEYDFIRLITEFGSAVYPLLDEVRIIMSEDKKTAEWFGKLYDEAHRMVVRYPVYLKTEIINLPQLSDTQVKILKLLAEAMTVKQIAERIGLSDRNTKFHTLEIYKKLGVNSKTDAVLSAKNLGII